jgi:hypothetical protein
MITLSIRNWIILWRRGICQCSSFFIKKLWKYSKLGQKNKIRFNTSFEDNKSPFVSPFIKGAIETKVLLDKGGVERM